MRIALLLLFAIAVVSGTATAGRNADGAMVVHVYNGPLSYTDTYNFCTDSEFSLPSTCQELVTTSDETADQMTVLWLVAAFAPGSSPSVTTLQFGIRHNLPPNQGYFAEWNGCGPGFIELPDQGWPDPNDCGNLVAYSTPVYDQMFKFYYFAVWHDDQNNFFGTRTYPSTNEAKFVDDGSPPIEDLCTHFGTMRWGVVGENDCPVPHTVGACCLPDGICLELPNQAECETMGGVWQGDSVPCDPNPCPPLGACCFADGTCQMLTREYCEQMLGMWFPDIPCEPNPCGPTPPGACCFDDGHCEQLPDWDCQGEFHGPGTHCYSDTCPPAGACCLDMNGNCVILIPTACTEQGGVYQGDGSTCDPDNPCYGFPTVHTTWGRIRAQFR